MPNIDLSKLNEPQREAVLYTEGPLLVLAGAGSGKTRVLTHRIAHLVLDQNVSPWNILALTFTNKAAQEMRERVEKLVGMSASNMWVLTFHSCCVRILRNDIEKLGYDNKFVIYDDSDQQTLVKHIIKDMNLNDKVFAPRAVLSQISNAKNHSLTPISYLRETAVPEQVITIYSEYEKQLHKNNALDFDDLLLKTLELFQKNPDVLSKYQERFHYILVDEYQDTNMSQYHIVQMLSGNRKNICVVGDDDQSIYGWRGADIRNILEFEKDFSGTKTIRLEQNYRSTESILNAANLVISHNRGRKQKTLWTAKKGGSPIDVIEASDDREEAMTICSRIASGVLDNGQSYNDYAILYRTHAQSRVLEMYLKSYNIPYRVYGGISFFQRAEVKDLLSYFRLLVNPSDDVAFRRVINVPKRGLGDAAIALLEADANVHEDSLLNSALRLSESTTRYAAKFHEFCDVLVHATLLRGEKSLSSIMEQIIADIHYDEYLREDKKENYEVRAEIVQELLNYLSEFEEGLEDSEDDPLESFLENVALFAATDQMDSESGTVAMMTLHSAKGLEFPIVFLCGMEQGLFPSSQSAFDPEKMEEERRLCYVGITRAMDSLHLSFARQRMSYGSIEYCMPSIFLEELKEALPNWNASQPSAGSYPKKQTLTMDEWSTVSKTDMHGLKKPEPKQLHFDSIVNGPVKKDNNTPTYTFRVGMRVKHRMFGEGTILKVSGSGSGQTLEIDFDNGQTKQLAASYAPVTPVE